MEWFSPLKTTSEMLLSAVLLWHYGDNLSGELHWVKQNAGMLLVGAVGLFITFVGFYFMYLYGGASIYTFYAVSSMLLTTLGVGLLVLREPYNAWHLASGIWHLASGPRWPGPLSLLFCLGSSSHGCKTNG